LQLLGSAQPGRCSSGVSAQSLHTAYVFDVPCASPEGVVSGGRTLSVRKTFFDEVFDEVFDK